MNINPVSFKGTFCVKQKDITTKKIEKLLAKKEELQLRMDSSSFTTTDDLYLHLPNKFDSKLIKTLNKLSIPYTQLSETDSLSPDSIVSRMILNTDVDNKDRMLQTVDTEKLDTELRKNQYRYIGKNGANGSGLRYERFKMFLKTNQQIKSPVVYLEKYPNGTIATNVYDGRHRFAVLRDMGIKQIPITIDKKSIALAKEIGLIK